MLLDRNGQPITRTPVTSLNHLLLPERNIFEGIVNATLYDDAIEAAGECAHCGGKIEGTLRFDKDYLKAKDVEERVRDIKMQLWDKIQEQHYCIPRLDGPKLPVKDFLRRFV